MFCTESFSNPAVLRATNRTCINLNGSGKGVVQRKTYVLRSSLPGCLLSVQSVFQVTYASLKKTFKWYNVSVYKTHTILAIWTRL